MRRESAFAPRLENAPDTRGGRADSLAPRPRSNRAFFRTRRRKLFRRSSVFLAPRNHRRAARYHFAGCKFRGRPSANRPAGRRPLALRLARPEHRDVRRIKLFSAVRSQGTPAGCAQALLLPASGGVRVRIRLQETTLRAPVRSPSPTAAPRIPRVRKMKSRWYPRPRRKRGPRQYAANLPRFGGSRVASFRCAPPSRPFPRALARDPQPPHFRSGKTTRHEISESNAPPRESIRGRLKGTSWSASATSPRVPGRVRRRLRRP